MIFENPSHFSPIFRLRNAKISLRNFRISLRNFEITLSNPKISLLDFRRVKILAEIPQICVLFCQKSRVKTFYFFVKILYLFGRSFQRRSSEAQKKKYPATREYTLRDISFDSLLWRSGVSLFSLDCGGARRAVCGDWHRGGRCRIQVQSLRRWQGSPP